MLDEGMFLYEQEQGKTGQDKGLGAVIDTDNPAQLPDNNYFVNCVF